MLAELLVVLATAFMSQAATGSGATPPPSAAHENLVERPVTVGTGEWAVRAMVTLPQGSGPFPGVVLVHGSGPGTLDMNVGGSTIYRDLARGLAARGIAVTRYEKRTTQHAARFRERGRRATLREEFIEDASQAARLLQATDGVDPAQVYIFGNSQGGGLAPGIANALGLAGSITMSGSPRQPGDIILQQAEYTAQLAAGDAERVRQAEEVMSGARRLQNIAAESDPDGRILGQPVWYWREIMAVDPARDINALLDRGGRAAILWGERDYLVTEEDWNAWRVLGQRDGLLVRSYPALNHIMQEGVGRMTPAEYAWTRPVSENFISDLAAWIKAAP